LPKRCLACKLRIGQRQGLLYRIRSAATLARRSGVITVAYELDAMAATLTVDRIGE
jgi:hypothetical protein